jgi:hypothetical protein
MSKEPLGDRLRDYLSSLPYQAETPEELRADFEDFLRNVEVEPRRRRRKQTNDERLSTDAQLPPELADRIARWEAARLRYLEPLVKQARLSLGRDSAPFLGDRRLAKEIWRWLTTRNSKRRGAKGEDPMKFSREVMSFQPEVYPTDPSKTEEQNRGAAFRRVMQNMSHNVHLIAMESGASAESVAVWLLADIRPKLPCMSATGHEAFRGPATVTLLVNPDVVKPEEVVGIFRRLRRMAGAIDRRLVEFLYQTSRSTTGVTREQFDLWQDLYPLRQYKDFRSFRVACARARRSQRRPDVNDVEIETIAMIRDELGEEISTPAKLRVLDIHPDDHPITRIH